MRYLLHTSQKDELQARQEYLYDIFHMFFLPLSVEGSFIVLTPVGSLNLDVLFITGHTNYVYTFLTNDFPEKSVIITSCFGTSFREFAKTKAVFVPNRSKGLCRIRDGAAYGFGFNISDAELDFYNAQGSIMERIQKAYTRL